MRSQRYALACLIFIALWWVLWGISPRYRDIWVSESFLVLVTVPLTVFIHFRIGLSNPAYTLITMFLAFHIVGSHYSYAEVPLGEWARETFGYTRNHYDRLVHFLFGFLLAVPIRELFTRGAKIRGPVTFWIALSVVMAGSLFYELLEWWFLLGMDPDAGISFLGAQGDVWDAQKDSALASLGALITLCALYLAEKRSR